MRDRGRECIGLSVVKITGELMLLVLLSVLECDLSKVAERIVSSLFSACVLRPASVPAQLPGLMAGEISQ